MMEAFYAALDSAVKTKMNQVDVEIPAGAFPTGDVIYSIPPEELQPEISIMAELLPAFAADQRDWGHVNLGIEELYNAGHKGAGVLVCIADTGIDYEHPDLKPRIILNKCRDFTGSNAGFMDRQGHGTHCAGIVAASSDGEGLIGVAPEASLMSSKVLGDQGSGASTWIAAGIRHATAQGADIISLSLGGPSPDQATRAAIQEAVNAGVWVVCAAGNDGGPANSYPGHYDISIAVAASDRNDKRASFSTTNRENDITAPGVSIMSTLPRGRYGAMSGTSMATPYVAGCLAILRGALKKAGLAIPRQSEILELMGRTSKDLGAGGKDSEYGFGLISTKGMLGAFDTKPNPPTEPPTNPPTIPGEWLAQRVLTVRGKADKITSVELK